MKISIRWKHSSGHIVEELGYFRSITNGFLCFYGDKPSKGKPSREQSMPLDKVVSVLPLKEA